MGIAKLYGQKASGTNINGILKDYHAYAGENISAGDLVEYINGISSSISATDVSTYISSYKANAVQLDENRIAVTYYKDTKMLCCTIITIQNLQISIGTEYSVSLSNTFTNYPSIALIDTNKLLIFFNLYNSSYSPTSIPCAVVATVSGSTISFGSVVQSTSNNGYVCLDLCKVDTDKAVAGLYYAGNDNRCSNWVITVSGTVPSLSATVKVQNYYKTENMTLSQLDTNKFLMSWSRDSKKASICIGTVSGTSISYSVSTVSGETTIYMYNTCVINKSKFVYFIYDSTASCCIGVGSISGSSITLSDKIALNMNINEYLRAKALDETRVAFAVSDGQNSSKATLRVATVEGTAITLGTSFVTSLSSRRFSYLDSLIEGQLFALHSNNSNNDNYLYLYGVDGTIISNTVIQNVYEQQVRKTTTSKFDGVAKTSGVGTEITGIPINNIVVNGDFSDGLNNIEVDSYKKLSEYAVIMENNENILKIKTIKAMPNVSHFLRFPVVINTSHVYYMRASVKGEINYTDITSSISYFTITCYGLGIPGGSNSVYASTSWKNFSAYGSPTESSNYIMINCQTDGNYYYFIKDVMLCDLTAEFGAGNEPTKEWCDKNLVIEDRDLVSIYTL